MNGRSTIQSADFPLCLVQIWLAGHWCHYHWGVQEVHREGQGPLTIDVSNRQSCWSQVEHVISTWITWRLTMTNIFISLHPEWWLLVVWQCCFLWAIWLCFFRAWRPWKDASSPVNVPEPTNEETLTILHGLAKKYEDTMVAMPPLWAPGKYSASQNWCQGNFSGDLQVWMARKDGIFLHCKISLKSIYRRKMTGYLGPGAPQAEIHRWSSGCLCEICLAVHPRPILARQGAGYLADRWDS